MDQPTGGTENLDDSGPLTIPAVFTGDVPATVLDAYRRAADLIHKAQSGCHLPVELLEAIGKVEANHAEHGQVDGNGTTLHPILGPALDGAGGFAAIPDTDGGRLDGDPAWDRAVGPMQILPSTWATWSDDRANPNNVYDASLVAAHYLCADNRDLGTPEGLSDAILSYNHSTSYRNLVLAWMSTYAKGITAVPDIRPLTVQTPVQAQAMPVKAVTPPRDIVAAAPPRPATPQSPLPTTSTPPPTTSPSANPLPTTPPPPTDPPPTAQPAASVPGLICGVTGLVGSVTGLLGGLLGSHSGNNHRSHCDDGD